METFLRVAYTTNKYKAQFAMNIICKFEINAAIDAKIK